MNTYFATDAMVNRLRGIADELRALDDGVRAEELDGRVKAARQEAGRALRDRLDLYGDDGGSIRLGRHRFAVNTRPIELTLVPHRDTVAFAITGTDYRAPVRDADFAATRHLWDQTLVSERGTYRASTWPRRSRTPTPATCTRRGRLLAVVRDAAADPTTRLSAASTTTARILEALLRLDADAGLLRYRRGPRRRPLLDAATGPPSAPRGPGRSSSPAARGSTGAWRPHGHWTRRSARSPDRRPSRTGRAALVEGWPPPRTVTSQGPQTAQGFGEAHRDDLDGDLRALGDDLAARRQLARRG